jgi:hypothetical protein
MNETSTIRIRDLKKSFGDKVVLEGVNMDVRPGDWPRKNCDWWACPAFWTSCPQSFRAA